MYIMCFCPLNYDDNINCHFFYLNVMDHCSSHQFRISDILVFFFHDFSKQSENYIKFDLHYQSAATFKVSQFLLPKRREHQTAEQYQRSDNCDELDHKADVH